MLTQNDNKYSIDPAIKKDMQVLSDFIEIYCKENHRDAGKTIIKAPGKIGRYLEDKPLMLCSDCGKLLLYAVSKRLVCPYDPKPSCKKCTTHCYRDVYRERIRDVMRFSGKYLLRKGKLGLLKKYLF